jgi:N,N'-diacetylchitobiose phosphorylase
MQYGHFDETRREYVITRPDTPRAWSNYLGSRRYGGIITAGAGGYSFTRSPAEGRILRHRYNSVPMDLPGRQFYLLDLDSGEFWSAAWQATAKPLDLYQTETRFGPGYAVITSDYDGLRAESTYYIPLDAEFEYWRLKVSNSGTATRRLRVFSFCEFTTEWNLINDTLNLQYTQYIGRAHFADGMIAASSCAHLPADPENFANRDQSRHWWMTQCLAPVTGHDCDREAFIGPYGGFHAPAAVVGGACTGSQGFSDNTCGALQADLVLAPGESSDVLILLGIGEASSTGGAVVENFGNLAAFDAGLEKLKAHWHGLLDTFQARTPDAAFDAMTNTWGAYNALMTFEWSRSCSLVYTGQDRDGYGFRDTVQDCLGVTAMVPDEVRSRLLLMLSAQDSSGGAQPEVRPWSHAPGQMKPTPASHYRSDDCLWFFNAFPAYVDETGDHSFYDIIVPYADEGEATVLGHLRRALEFNLERTGANSLPCGLSADWNDCLKLGYQGESIFVAFQLRLGLDTYANLCAARALTSEAAWAQTTLATLDAAIQRIAWDGAWFRWAIAEDGTIFGTKDYPEGQIYLNTQAWAILSGAATPEQSKAALAAVRDHLACEWGVAMCAPPFSKTPVEVMRAVLFNEGNKENGGIFSHTQSWAVLAEIAAGNGDQAYAYYCSFLPAAQNERAEIREIEPYVHCQSTHSQFSEKTGKSRVPWLSGTASWAHHTATRHILGIRPENGGLRIDPCIPSDWPGFTVTRRIRGATLHIEISNPAGRNHGISRLSLDGEEIPGNFIAAELIRDGLTITATIDS